MDGSKELLHLILSESVEFSGSLLPLSYYNAVGAQLEEKYELSDQDKARLVLGLGGGGTLNNNTFCFPRVVRSRLPAGVKVCLSYQ